MTDLPAKLMRLEYKEGEPGWRNKVSPRDQFAQEELVSVRTIPPNRRSVTGLLPSRKNGPTVPFESALERDLATILEFDDAVLTFEAQPVEVVYSRGTRRCTGVPDFLATYRTHLGRRPLLCDVKYRKELFERWTELKPRLVAARRYARERGWDYRILTEIEIRTQYLANARFLLPYQGLCPDPIHEQQLLEMLATMRATTVQRLLEACCKDLINRAQLIPTLWCLVGRLHIGTDLERPLTMSSDIWLPV